MNDVLTVRRASFRGAVRTVEDAAGWGGGGFALDADEYVTLEPTDIVRIDEERFRMVNRKAAVGERVIIVSSDKTESACCHFRHTIGEIGDVEDRLSDRAGVNGWYILDGDYRVLEPLTTAHLLSEQSAQDQAAATISALALRLDALTERMDALEESVHAAYTTQPTTTVDPEAVLKAVRKFSEGLKRSVSDAFKTPQQRRDEIVERAKADVARLENTRVVNVPVIDSDHTAIFNLEGGVGDTVEFIVNRVKRTVVALISVQYGNESTVWARGIAKCAPGDVFNAHIGKAIALYRALGLEVPAEYLSVPQPTEIRVGDVVDEEDRMRRRGKTVAALRPEGHMCSNLGLTFVGGGWAFIDDCRIVDDTREEVAA